MKYRTNVIWQRQKAALPGPLGKGDRWGWQCPGQHTHTPPTLFPPGARTRRSFLPGDGAVLEEYEVEVDGDRGVGRNCPPTFPGWSRALQYSGGSPGLHPARGLLLLFQGNNKF